MKLLKKKKIFSFVHFYHQTLRFRFKKKIIAFKLLSINLNFSYEESTDSNKKTANKAFQRIL